MAAHKTIFITGGASGIGRAVARKFAAQGWFVGLADINEPGLRETAAMLPVGMASCHRLDVRDRAAWDAALAACAEASGGRIEVVFNNAGVPVGGALIDCTTEEIDRTVDINLKGVLYGAQAAHKWLKASAPGSCLLNTASAAGIYGSPGASIYSTTKFGVRALTEALDGEWHADGIKVADLMPGFIDTPLLDIASNRASNQPIRDRVAESGLELSPVADAAEMAWQAVHGTRLHNLVGKTARQIAFAARWMPGSVRKRMRAGFRALGD